MSAPIPRIPSPPSRWVTRIAVPLVIVLGAAAALLWSGWNALMPALDVRVMQVVVKDAAVEQSRSGPAIQAPGWVEPAPFPIMVTALTPGTVRSVLVLEGEQVKEGQVLAELYDEEQQLALRLADAEHLEAVARRNEVADELRRKSQLVASGAVPQAEVARLALRQEGLDAAVAAASVERDMKALVLERTKVRAPKAGVVMQRLVSPGMATGAMQDSKPLIELYDPSSLQVRADVPLADAGLVAPGQGAEIRVDVLPNRAFKGTVARLVHQADIAKNTVQAKVLITDPAPELKPDMLARVRIMTGSPAQGTEQASSGARPVSRTVIWAPSAALRRSGPGQLEARALVAAELNDGIGVAQERVVQLDGSEHEGWMAVTSGLRAGDLLIAPEGPQPKPGARIRVALDDVRAVGGAHGSH